MIDLSLIDRTKTNAIVIRHADRDQMEIHQTEQPLNELGEKNAFELGKKLQGFKKYVLFSSPVDRCQGTADFIQRGLGFKENINILSNILGKPGPFVVDHKNNAFRTYSCKTVIEKQIAHEKLEGIRATQEGSKILIDFVTEEMNKVEPGTLLIFITHDAIVGPIIFELTGEKFNHEHWPDFSDGFIVEKDESEFKIIRNKKIFNLREF